MAPKKQTAAAAKKTAAASKKETAAAAAAPATTIVAPKTVKAASVVAAKKAPAPSAKKRAGVVTATIVEKVAAAAPAAAAKAAVKKEKKVSGGKKPVVAVAPYKVLLLRNLPEAFQEGELTKYLSQFGPAIERLYVLRVKNTRRSRGVAYVKFAKSMTEEESDAILDECDGIVLGDKMVTAKWSTLKKSMPSVKSVLRNRKIDYANRTRGVRLNRKKAKKLHAAGVKATAAAVPLPASSVAPLVDASAGSKRKRPEEEVPASASLADKQAAYATMLVKLRAMAASEKKTNEGIAKKGVKYVFLGATHQLKALEPLLVSVAQPKSK